MTDMLTDIFNLAPEAVASIKELYERGVPTTDICEQFGINRKSFWTFRRAQGWTLRAPFAGDAAQPESVGPAALIARLEATLAREIARAETAMKGRSAKSTEARARTLSSLVKTLGELKRLKGDGGWGAPPDEPPRRNINELRAELARRLERLAPQTPT